MRWTAEKMENVPEMRIRIWSSGSFGDQIQQKGNNGELENIEILNFVFKFIQVITGRVLKHIC